MLWFETCPFNQINDISNVKHKNFIHQRCWFVQKPFSSAHVNVHGVKCFLLNNVWLLLSMLNSSFGSKLVFTVTMGAFTKGKSTLHYKCTFSVVSVH
ncbi:hypothetical protein AB205_0074250, partial [Aquarana catesbeiana]